MCAQLTDSCFYCLHALHHIAAAAAAASMHHIIIMLPCAQSSHFLLLLPQLTMSQCCCCVLSHQIACSCCREAPQGITAAAGQYTIEFLLFLSPCTTHAAAAAGQCTRGILASVPASFTTLHCTAGRDRLNHPFLMPANTLLYCAQCCCVHFTRHRLSLTGYMPEYGRDRRQTDVMCCTFCSGLGAHARVPEQDGSRQQAVAAGC